MSYARFGSNSDVYVFSHVGGYVQCCACLFVPDRFDDGSVNLHSVDEITAHMGAHADAGHNIDPDLLDPATYADEDFIAMCHVFLCRENEGHADEHTPIDYDRHPDWRGIRERQLTAALPGTDKETAE